MKNNDQFVRRLAVVALLTLSNSAQAYSTNQAHELGVYSLYEYGEGVDGYHWKGTVTPGYNEDPAGYFWDFMTGGTSTEYAHTTSRRRVNAQVNYHTVFPIDGDGWKDWDQFDLVFFYGHNNMITPPHPTYSSSFWSNNSGTWQTVAGSWPQWGTAALPYEYYPQDLTTGATQPGGVVYLYEPYTSALLGYHFDADATSTYQTTAQNTPAGNTAGTTGTFTSGLGTNDLEWLILHGCQAVIVANSDGTSYNSMGVKAYKNTFDRFHIILGHYRSYYVSELTDLATFAYELTVGVPVQGAYFNTDPAKNSSAISAECIPWVYDLLGLEEYYLTFDSYMNHDQWLNPKPDKKNCGGWWIFKNKRAWYTKWIREAGTQGSEW